MAELRALSYQESLRLIRSFSWKVLRRLRAAGVHSLDIDDVVQEMSLAYIRAIKNWSPEHKTKFSTYLMRGMVLQSHRFVESQIEEGRHLTLDAGAGADDEEENTFHNIHPDEAPSPEELIIGKQFRNRVVSGLSDQARKLVELLEDPPIQLLNEVRAIAARAEYARSQGKLVRASNNVTLSLIFDLLGISTADRSAIRREIKEAINKVMADDANGNTFRKSSGARVFWECADF